jgi:hypothetical protein
MAQFGRPSGDVTTGAWTATGGTGNLASAIDEATAVDTDFIGADNSTNDFAEVSLSSLNDPEVNTIHVIRYRYRKSASSGNARSIQVALYQGGTQIATGTTHTPTTTTWTAGTFTLTGTQADAITDYTDLRLRFIATGTTSGSAGNRRHPQISWAEFEVPDATIIDNVPRGAYSKTGGGIEILSTEHRISNNDLISITYQNTSASNGQLRLRDHATNATIIHTISVPAGTGQTTVTPPAGYKYDAAIEIRMGGSL